MISILDLLDAGPLKEHSTIPARRHSYLLQDLGQIPLPHPSRRETFQKAIKAADQLYNYKEKDIYPFGFILANL